MITVIASAAVVDTSLVAERLDGAIEHRIVKEMEGKQ